MRVIPCLQTKATVANHVVSYRLTLAIEELAMFSRNDVGDNPRFILQQSELRQMDQIGRYLCQICIRQSSHNSFCERVVADCDQLAINGREIVSCLWFALDQ